MNLKFFKVNLENLAVLFTPHLGNNGHFKNEKKMVQKQETKNREINRITS